MPLPERRRSGPVSYREAGEGPPLLLLHGLGGNSGTWAAQYAGLAQRHRVIGWDAPGYGESEPLADPGPDAYADAAAGLLDRLGIASCAVLGHSMGGVVAPRLAARRPGRVRRLALSSTKASFAGDAAAFEARSAEFRELDDAARGRARAEAMVAPGADPEILRRVAETAAEVPFEGWRGGVAVLAAGDNRALLPELDIPILLLSGSEDRIAPPEAADELARLMPRAATARIEGVGHAAYAEKPDDYNALLGAFLDG